MSEIINEHIEKVRTFLEIRELDFSISDSIKKSFPSEDNQLAASQSISEFVSYFSLFKQYKSLLEDVKTCVLNTCEVCQNPSEIMDTLLKTILFNIIEEMLIYSKMKGDTDKILNTIGQSLETLAPSALIINLGFLAKPIYEDVNYQAEKRENAQIEVQEIISTDTEKAIKIEINNYLKSFPLDLDAEKQYHEEIDEKITAMASENGMDLNGDSFKLLSIECHEMLCLKLTALSLVMDFGDDDLMPEPISI